MGKLQDKWNKNSFSVYKSEEKTVLKLIENINNFVGDELVKEIENKTNVNGNHLGSWQGLNRPTLSEEGMRATVEKHIQDIDVINNNIQNIEKNQLISVLEFGADPSFSVDSTESIQSAIDYSNETGMTIYFPRGKYKVDGTLYVRDFISLKGDNTTLTGINEFASENNKNNTLIVTSNNIVFQGVDKREDTLTPLKVGIEGLAFQHGGNVDNSTLFYKLELRSSHISNSLFRGYATVFLGVMKYVTIIENNAFYDCRKYFLKGKNISGITSNLSGLVDSYIQNNYINGSVYASNMIGFDIHYPSYSSVTNNFIDFFKIGFDITGGQGFTILNNDIQFCMRGINLTTASNINISSNRFGLMNYESNKMNWIDRMTDISHWENSWTGIYLNNQVNAISIIGNQGMTIDKLIRINSAGLKDINIQSNTTPNVENLIDIISIRKDPNVIDDGERIFIDETQKIKYNEQPYNLQDKTFKNHRILYKGIPLINTGEGRFFKTFSGNIFTDGIELLPSLTVTTTPTGWTIENDKLIYNSNSTTWSHIQINDISVVDDTKYAILSSCNNVTPYATDLQITFKDIDKNQVGEKVSALANGESLIKTPINTKYITLDYSTNLSNTNVVFDKPSIKKLK